MDRVTRYVMISLVWSLLGSSGSSYCWSQTVARQWNEALLEAIRIDFPAPTIHARNLYHTFAAMYDAWAVYDPIADGHFIDEKHSVLGVDDLTAARAEAISYAAYRVLRARYALAASPTESRVILDDLMDQLGYDKYTTTTEGNSPAAIGNRIAQQILSATLNDGSNEALIYIDPTGYEPVNVPMVVDYPDVVTPDASGIANPNRWQPLFLESAVTQNDLQGESLQTYIGPHWGDVTTFALGRGQAGPHSWSSIDPGPPPELNGVGDAEYREDSLRLIRYSNSLDPNSGPGSQMINLSPKVSGNRELGTHADRGYAVNPVTNEPYEDNFVRLADYGRVLAEFWADGPRSETPPGHWNVIANEVADHPAFEKRIEGQGPILDDLHWDVFTYLALNGAVHDAGVAAWGVKRQYDYVRPITKIRYQGSLGQSSDDTLPSYHQDGLELEPGLVELITAESIAEGGKHRNVYVNANRDAEGNFAVNFQEAELVDKIAVLAWNHEPEEPASEVSGTDWILAQNWVPYQDDNFVTPAFAAYVSGHSAFSRAAAEVLARLTGSEFFPGGMGSRVYDSDFLKFEQGPTQAVELQWGTYFDAADEAGISRLYGGIHVPADDFAGRIMGSEIGIAAVDLALDLFVADDLTWNNSVGNVDIDYNGVVDGNDLTVILGELNDHLVTDSQTGILPALEGAPSLFYDTNGDGYVSAIDALNVVWHVYSESLAQDTTIAASADVRLLPESGARSWLLWLGIVMCGNSWRKR